ncbi:MAG: metallophosphoesterase, partial [Muribaculaceae bacterium]
MSVLLSALLITAICLPNRTIDDSGLVGIMWMLFTYIAFYIPKYFFVIARLIALLFRLRNRWASLIIPTAIALWIFATMWWGAFVTRTDTQTRDVELKYANLPDSFTGYKAVQISDIHLGSYGNDTTYISQLVDEINAINPDIVFFTGDIVNRHSVELKSFVPVLKRLKAKDGIFSILCNHDYGDYYTWESPRAKEDNMQELYRYQEEMGWTLLNNSHSIIHNGNDSIVVIGVENWGDAPFPVYGDLKKAYPETNDNNFKILLTHNPAHWRAEVVNKTNIDLSLCGHTHAMQIELDLFGCRISPAVWRYKDWGGLYREGKQAMYVNIGIGEVALPMRIGATPEITVITFNKD